MSSPPREDLLRPVHKGIRSTIYAMGHQLQLTDFTDEKEVPAILETLRHELTAASMGACILCVLHSRAGDEERVMFPPVKAPTAQLIRDLLNDHAEIVRQMVALDALGRRLRATHDPQERVELGIQLNSAANDLFAYYLNHMNREEREPSPVLWKLFTDEELRAMRREIMRTGHPEMIRATVGWTLSSADVGELVTFFTGMKQ
jgi:hypothetical protein